MATSPPELASPGPPPATRKSSAQRVFAWTLAFIALAFVAYSVPLRDRCNDPSASVATAGTRAARVPVTRDTTGCVLHRPGGDNAISAADCARLTCEPGLASTLEGARLEVLLLLLAVYFLSTAAWAARWRALLALAKVPLTIRGVWRITLEAQAGGIALPGGVGGDALRVGFVAGKGASLPTVIASVALDRAIGLVTLAGIATIASIASLGGGPVPPMLLVVGSIPLAFVAGLLVLRWPPLARAPVFQRGPLASVARPVLAYLGEAGAPRAIGKGVLISLVVGAAQLVVLRGFVVALRAAPTSELWVYVGSTMSLIVGAIPALPGGWGTSDAAFVYFFAKAGLAPSIALAVSLLYRLFWYASGALGAILYLLRAPRGAPHKA